MDAVPSPCMCTLCPGAGGRGGEFWLTSSLTEGEGRRGGSRSWAPPRDKHQSWGARVPDRKGPVFQGLKLLLGIPASRQTLNPFRATGLQGASQL